jgi:hypothetical protein
MTFDLFGGRRLLLAGFRLGWFWIAVGAVALVLLLILYREERRLISRRAVYRGDVASIEATLKINGAPGRDVAVTLDRPGALPMRQTVQAPAEGDGARPVTFRVPLDEVGTVPLTVAVAPLDGDVRPDNDRRTVTVQVADERRTSCSWTARRAGSSSTCATPWPSTPAWRAGLSSASRRPAA